MSSNNMESAIVIVDPISTGRVLASKAIDRGHQVIAVWTKGSSACQALLGECEALPFLAQVHEPDNGDAEEVAMAIQNLGINILFVTPGCESGVELNDILCERLGTKKSNGLDLSEARRDKWAMAERIRECGTRAVRQSVCTRVEEAEEFITAEGLTKWIIKPRRSAASDGVYLCVTSEDTKNAFRDILGKRNLFGESNVDVLIQEYLAGTEYVVDTVSCNGNHKVVALWEYAKTDVNGSPFVYHDMHLYNENQERQQQMAEYVFDCLTALGVKWGPCHAEVMWLREDDAPCLVEVGARPHGAGGNFPALADPVIGYNQLDVTLDTFLDPASFDALPALPGPPRGHAIQYFFVGYAGGHLAGWDLSLLDELESCVGVDMHVRPGQAVAATVDLVTAPGVVRLVHADREVVLRDNRRLRRAERGMLTIVPPPPPPPAAAAAPGAAAAAGRPVLTKDNLVVIVDPISSGRVLAEKSVARGYRTVAVWTPGGRACLAAVGACGDLGWAGQVDAADHADARALAAAVLRLGGRAAACTVGCESGVELCDQLGEALGLAAGNGATGSLARRDKYTMQEVVRAAGLRAIRQAVVNTAGQALAWVRRDRPAKWIMKPRRSAGSDGVFLCTSEAEALRAFHEICGRRTIFGEENRDVLMQEYLAGTEYVVDTVSADGRHAAVALWEYEKAKVNGSAFVYHDMHLYSTADGRREAALARYVFGCLDALGVRWGPCHAEAIWLEDEDRPCLVEVGARPHGAGGNFPELCDPVIGYNQLDVTLDALLDPASLAALPACPRAHRGHAIQYFFVAYRAGLLEEVDLSLLDTFKSCVGVDLHCAGVGRPLPLTTDLLTAPGVVRLVHADREVVERENRELRAAERGMFRVREEGPGCIPTA